MLGFVARRLPILLVGLIVLVACSADTATLQGRVLDAYTGKPVKNATLAIGQHKSLTTGVDGSFSTTSWSPKDTLTVSAGDYETQTLNLAEKPDLQQTKTPTVTLDVVVRPNTLRGVITDSYTHKPVANARVGMNGGAGATSDANGVYVLRDVPPSFKLVVSAPDYADAQADISRATERLLALRPNVVRGEVKDRYAGKAIAGAQVKAGDTTATTGSDGRYELRNAPEQGEVSFTAAGYNTVKAPLQRTTKLDATLRPNVLRGVVKDRLIGKAIGGVQVKLGDATAITGADGRYELHNVPEQGEVSFSAAGYDFVKQPLPAATEMDATLRPNVVRGVVKDSNTGQGIADVVVIAGAAKTTTSADGRYELNEVGDGAELTFSRDGYDAVKQAVGQTMNVDAALRPNAIMGRVVDQADGKPLAEATVLATPALTGTAIAVTRTDAEGRYKLANVSGDAYIKALLPGYRRGEAQVTAGAVSAEIRLEKFEAKALYLKAPVAARGMNVVNQYYDVIDHTELNSAVIDLKSDDLEDVGFIYYKSQAPAIVEAGTSADRMPIRGMLAEAKRRNIYTIARIHVFAHDNALLAKHPDWYIQKNGKPWFADFGIAWLDTYDERVWDYNIQLAVEAAQLGFDEIQFDYIRFPSDGNLAGATMKGRRDPHNHPDEMYGTIGRLCERAQRAINAAGAFFSVDVFGYAAWEPQASIGQNLQVMGQHVDYVYPMVYPSAFALHALGFQNSAAHPFELVNFSMQMVKRQLNGPASRARVRPWLQDFTLKWVPDQYIVPYGPNEVRAQIDAAEKNRSNGITGWALWNPDNAYNFGALKR
jgi:hypothetical protein